MNIDNMLSAYSANQSTPVKSRQQTTSSVDSGTADKSQSGFAHALANAKSPGKQLEEYLAMSDAERYQLAWLKKRGMSKETFDALPAEEKQKLMEEMRQDMEREMKAKIEAAKTQNKQVINLLS